MQLWFSRSNGVSLREQLITQFVLSILCGDLAAGERLPSTRELARRFHLHPNTVSAGYRRLAQENWVELRRGSGVYVSKTKPAQAPSSPLILDQLIANFFREARKTGEPVATVRERLQHWLDMQPPSHFLLIEPREELRRIVTHEMRQALTLPIKSCGSRKQEFLPLLDGAIPVALARNAEQIAKSLSQASDLIALTIRSVPSSLSEWLPSRSGALVGIASGWPEFLKLARTVLLAAGFDKEALVFRDARHPKWRRGLQQTAAVVCDSVTAEHLPRNCRPIVFSVLSDASRRELQQYDNFVRNPLAPAL